MDASEYKEMLLKRKSDQMLQKTLSLNSKRLHPSTNLTLFVTVFCAKRRSPFTCGTYILKGLTGSGRAGCDRFTPQLLKCTGARSARREGGRSPEKASKRGSFLSFCQGQRFSPVIQCLPLGYNLSGNLNFASRKDVSKH